MDHVASRSEALSISVNLYGTSKGSDYSDIGGTVIDGALTFVGEADVLSCCSCNSELIAEGPDTTVCEYCGVTECSVPTFQNFEREEFFRANMVRLLKGEKLDWFEDVRVPLAVAVQLGLKKVRKSVMHKSGERVWFGIARLFRKQQIGESSSVFVLQNFEERAANEFEEAQDHWVSIGGYVDEHVVLNYSLESC